MKFLFTFLVVAACSLSRVDAQASVVCHEDSLYSPSMARYVKFSVVLPPGYNESSRRYTTIYLLHGYSGTYRDWVTNTGLVDYASNYRYLIITPDGKNGWWTNSPQVKHAMYEDMIMKDLIPYVDQKYRTLSARHGRVIAGLSMGGFGAVKFALKYPGTFFYAASFSGALSMIPVFEDNLKTMDTASAAHRSRVEAFGDTPGANWTRNDVMTLVDSVDVKRLPYLYLSVGHADELRYVLDGTLALGTKLRLKGARFEMHETIGGHNWIFWDQEVKTLLEKIERYEPLNVK